jgi:SAM-dependent methyltransferase
METWQPIQDQARLRLMDRRKAMVRDAYDAIADTWGQARRTGSRDPREVEWLKRLFALLPDDARVLDLGCGSGAPILAELIHRGYRVTGVDLSREQLIRARTRCAAASLLQGDLAEIEFAPASFDGVIAYDSIWHLPRAEHQRVFAGICRWLVPGGAALFTLGAPDVADGEGLFTELMGAPIFYDAWPRMVSLQMLDAAGLTVLAQHQPPADHSLIVLVRK